ncbi:hypothetical protein [Photobacterium indicum]|uniref:hypothetical protein n=1 Tax=Photobacterium indicum TaxID=81447 RepID=UPI003D102055
MSKNETLTNLLDPLNKDLLEGKKVAFCIRKHLSQIIFLMKDGHSVSSIIENCDLPNTYTINSFYVELQRAKKKNRLVYDNINDTVDVIHKDSITPPPKKVITEDTDIEVSTVIRDNWINAFNFTQPLRITSVLYGNIASLTKAGWTPDNYHILRKELSITTSRKLISVVSVIRSSNYKRNIYKDNSACF